MSRRLRVAIACPGVGLVQRGFERLFRDLFELLRDDVDITLLKGGGPGGAQERRMLFLPRGGRFLKYVPLHRLIGRTPMHMECLTFAMAMMPSLMAGKYDLVHVIDPPLARVLFHLRRLTGARFRLLYTEGTAMPPGDYPPADHIHQISAATCEDAVRHGRNAADMTTIPCGISLDRFAVEEDRQSLRRKYGIAEDTFVVLSVAALNRAHKRIDYLIDEFSALPEGPMLWLDGSLDHGDADLPDVARARLGDRVRITHVDSSKVGELYRLADLFVHTAGFEAFGLSIAEAAACGLPVLTHDDPHFRWLIPNPACQLDMLDEGRLASEIGRIMADPEALNACRAEDYAKRTYAWPMLRDDYLALYHRTAAIT